MLKTGSPAARALPDHVLRARAQTWYQVQAQGSLLSPFGTKMPDTLSTAETTKLVNTVIPTYLDGTVITDEGSLAYLAGALYQAGEFYSRTGAFESLWLHGVAVAGSKTAVDSMNAVYFASGLLEDNTDDEYSFMNPVPPTAVRVAKYDVASVAQGTPKFTKAAEELGELDTGDFIVNPFKVREADREAVSSLTPYPP